MKKYFLLFAAGGLITLASCGGETAPVQTLNVDSLAQVKVDSIAAVEKAKSDSMVGAQAMITADSLKAVMKADSIAAAAAKAAGKKVPAPVKKATKTTPTKEIKATPANSKSKWDDDASKTEKKADPNSTNSKSKWD